MFPEVIWRFPWWINMKTYIPLKANHELSLKNMQEIENSTIDDLMPML